LPHVKIIEKSAGIKILCVYVIINPIIMRNRSDYPTYRRSNDYRDYEAERENYYIDDYYNTQGPRNGYENPDYIEQNYWHAHDDGERRSEYVPEVHYGRRWEDEHDDRRDGRHTVGYGNENSQYMRGYDRRMGIGPDREESFKPDGNRGRRDYGSWYEDERAAENRGDRPYYSGNDNGGRSYIDKSESRGRRGIDNEDTYESGDWRRRSRNGGFNDDTGFHLFEDKRSRSTRPSIREKRY
jgi:hypothetical protein